MTDFSLKYSMGKLPTIDYLATHPHFVVSTHNLSVGFADSIDEDLKAHALNSFDSFKYFVNYPQPFLPPTDIEVSEINGTDPCKEFVTRKRIWEKGKRTLLSSCKRHKQFASKLLSEPKVPKTISIPSKNIILLADHLKKDPDKEFSGTYNWYYNGGNLKTIHLGAKQYLVHPSYDKNGEIFLSSLHCSNGKWESNLHEKLSVSLSKEGDVFQIESQNSDILVRQRNDLFFLHCTSQDSSLNFEKFHIEQDGAAYVGSDIRPGTQGDFCSTTTQGNIQLWSSEAQCLIEEGEITEGETKRKGGWKTLKFIDESTFFYADRDVVHFVDARIGIDTSQKSWSLDGLTETCEEICALTHNNHSYVLTNHQLFNLDVRQGVSQRWTHGIPNSPFLINVTPEGRKDRIFLASQLSDCVVFLENEWETEETGRGKCHPYILPSLQETLHSARINGIGASYLIDSRFRASLTGICVLEGSPLNLLRLTSYGDVFCQSLTESFTPSILDFSGDESDAFTQWANKCEELYFDKAQPCASKLYSKRHILDKINSESSEDEEMESENQELTQEWHISKKKLLSYCDLLAPKLLKAWDLDSVEEWGDENEKNSEESDSQEEEDDNFEFKVLNWIQNYSKNDEISDVNERSDASEEFSSI